MHTCVNLYGVLVGWKQKAGRLTSVKRSVHIDRYIDTDIGRCRSQPTSNRSMSVWTYIDIAASLVRIHSRGPNAENLVRLEI